MKQIIFTAILIFVFCFATFAQMDENRCPKVTIVSLNKILVPFESAVFTAKIVGETEKYNVGYSWNTSRGQIFKGQDTSKIELMVSQEDFGANVTVKLKVNCSVPKCDGVKCTTQIIKETLWDNYYMAAPARQRHFVEQYKIVKKA
jgi:hypothetical protein